MSVKCGGAEGENVMTSCIGATVPMNDSGFTLLVDGAVDSFLALFNLGAIELAT